MSENDKITDDGNTALTRLPATYCSAFFDLATKWASRAIALDHLAEKNKCIITDAEAGIFRQFAEELIEVANDVQMRLDSANTTIEARREADALRRLVEACGSIDNDISTPAEWDEAYAEALAVIEAIEERYIDGCDTYEDWRFMGQAARDYLLPPNTERGEG